MSKQPDNVVRWMAEVLERFGKERLDAEVMKLGYQGDGSMEDAGCVELACLELLWRGGGTE